MVGARPEEKTTVQVAARQEFVKLPMVRQQRGAIARSTDQGGNYSCRADVGVNLKTTTAQATARQVARLSVRQQQQAMIAWSIE